MTKKHRKVHVHWANDQNDQKGQNDQNDQNGPKPADRIPVTQGQPVQQRAAPAAPSFGPVAGHHGTGRNEGSSDKAPKAPKAPEDAAGGSRGSEGDNKKEFKSADRVATTGTTTTTTTTTTAAAPDATTAPTPGFFLHTSTNPSRSVGSCDPPHFTHTTFHSYRTGSINYTPPINSAFTPTAPNVHHPATSFPFGPLKMDHYQANSPPGGYHFQPPVPDTTFGPMTHIYQPRFDNGMAFAQGQGQGQGQQLQQAPGNNVTVIGQPPAQPNNGQPVFVAAQPPTLVQGSPIPIQGGFYQYPGLPAQPVMMNGPPVMQAPPAAMGMGVPPPGAPVPVPGLAGNQPHLPPDVTGFGRTAGEVAMEQARFAYENNLFAPQDFKPADDDPSRYYPVREVDGNWTQRNRFTIDNLGDCRWYVTDAGYFYAVRQPN